MPGRRLFTVDEAVSDVMFEVGPRLRTAQPSEELGGRLFQAEGIACVKVKSLEGLGSSGWSERGNIYRWVDRTQVIRVSQAKLKNLDLTHRAGRSDARTLLENDTVHLHF